MLVLVVEIGLDLDLELASADEIHETLPFLLIFLFFVVVFLLGVHPWLVILGHEDSVRCCEDVFELTD